MPQARTIDEVLQRLTEILQICRNEKSRLGYFPALYLRVTEHVKAGIAAGRFEDGPRMERLDVEFANRYLAAWDAWRSGGAVTQCWRVTFEAGSSWRPVILQLLLAGMNVHINLDLAMAAAATCPGPEIENLKTDFDRINELLAELVDPIELGLAGISPWIGLVETFGGHAEGVVVNFDIRAARHLAWDHALRLAALQESHQDVARALAVSAMSVVVAGIGHLILHPKPLLQAGLLLVRLREERDVGKVMEALGRGANI